MGESLASKQAMRPSMVARMGSVTGSRMPVYGGKGFFRYAKELAQGTQACIKRDGLKTTLWNLAYHREHNYLLPSSQTKVGTDEMGNDYYEDTTENKYRGRDRWIIYKAEGSANITDYPPQLSSIPP